MDISDIFVSYKSVE
jgi:flagellum-specific peptidoglycan hydrolase FlgJ